MPVVNNRIGRPESALRAALVYLATIGITLAIAAPLIVLAWWRAS